MIRSRLCTIDVIYLAIGCGWMAFADWLVPRMILDALQGQSFSVLNRVFQGKNKPPAHYLELWRTFAVALTIGLTVHLAIFVEVRKRFAGGLLGYSIFAGLFLGLTVVSGPRHDYVAFLEIWSKIRGGGDPWFVHPVFGYATNAYGPLFNVLAWPSGWNALAPKLLFAYIYLRIALSYVAETKGSRTSWIFWVLNPWPWVEIAYFGHFDVLIGWFCIEAIKSVRRDRSMASGVWLAAGVLLKYLPIVFLPFLMFSVRHFRPRLAATCLGAVAIGLAASALVWGSATFSPLWFGSTRGSTLLSIFRFLRGEFSPLGATNFDRWSNPCLAVAGLIVFGLAIQKRLQPARACAMAALVTLLFYRVGFPQYQTVLFLLVSDMLVRERAESSADLTIPTSCWLYFGWLALFNGFYAAIGGVIHPGDQFAWVDEIVGLPTFVLGIVLMAGLVAGAGKWPEKSPALP